MTRKMRSGAAGLHEAVSRLIDYGYAIYLPVVDVGCDLICEVDGVAVRCQVKTTLQKRQGPSAVFDLRRRGPVKKESYKTDIIDIFILLHLRSQEAYVVPADHMDGRMKVRLRSSSEYRDAWQLIAQVAVKCPRSDQRIRNKNRRA